MREWWQHIPEHIDPIAFTVGFFSVHWYALCWIVGFSIALSMAMRYREEFCEGLSREDVLDLFLFLFVGALIGGRIGYALFYRPDIFLANPLGFFSPYHVSTGWSGIAGMSFHGGLLGVVLALSLFAARRKVRFFPVADLVSFVAPIALFFGRIGNFLAGELYGRATTFSFGMYVPETVGMGVLRHPSALYEAFLEGIFLFVVLFFLKQRKKISGEIALWFLMGYGVIRFFVEYTREPDPGIAFLFGLTRGQFLSSILFIFGCIVWLWLWTKNRGKMKE